MKTASAKSPADEIDPIFSELNLDSVGGNFFIGHFDRVPFRMELVANEQTVGLLFQTRFSKTKQPVPEFPPVPEGSALDALIKEKKAEFTADEDRAWFNLFAAHELIESGQLLPVLNEFTTALKAYVDFDDQPCFACKQTKAMQPIFHSEKLHLVCDACLEQINAKAAALTRVDTVNVAFSLLWGFVVALIGGFIWALGWMLFDFLFAGRTLPTAIFTIAFLILGAAVAFPIALIFKKIPRRGHRIAKWITIATCLLTAFFGESFFCAYHFARVFGGLPDFGQISAVWRIIIGEAGALYFAGKLLTLGMLIAMSLDWSKPKISLEEAVSPAR